MLTKVLVSLLSFDIFLKGYFFPKILPFSLRLPKTFYHLWVAWRLAPFLGALKKWSPQQIVYWTEFLWNKLLSGQLKEHKELSVMEIKGNQTASSNVQVMSFTFALTTSRMQVSKTSPDH